MSPRFLVFRLSGLLAVSGALTLAVFAAPAGAATFTVNTAADTFDGVCGGADCSLRDAIIEANATTTADDIHFSIGLGGPQTLVVGAGSAGLPQITQPVTIDGTTQPGYAGAPLIEVDGTVENGSYGLDVVSPPAVHDQGGWP